LVRTLAFCCPVLCQNSMRTENSAIPCRDGCPIQVIRSPPSAKNPFRTRIGGRQPRRACRADLVLATDADVSGRRVVDLAPDFSRKRLRRAQEANQRSEAQAHKSKHG